MGKHSERGMMSIKLSQGVRVLRRYEGNFVDKNDIQTVIMSPGIIISSVLSGHV